MSKPIKVIICGAGDMARKHIEAYRKLGHVEIAAVASRSLPRASVLSAEYNIPRCYDDIDAAFGKEKADIASVCVPTALHPVITIKAMAKGMHVVTEKPIALTVEAAREMIAAAEKHRRKLTVIFNRRFNMVWQELTRRLSSIGSPLVYNTQEIRSIRPKPAMHSQSANGGPIIDCCVHDFDMLLHVFGKAQSVFASGTVFGKNKPFLGAIKDFAVDTAHIDVEFENGHRAYLLYAWGFPQGQLYWQYRDFMGPDGIIRLMGEFGQEIRCYRSDGMREIVYDLRENGHETLIRKFVESVERDSQVPVQPEEAIEALKISLAALKSIESGKKEPV
jgi:UDP-N-acetylglucosamine 3-dehydrogenase